MLVFNISNTRDGHSLPQARPSVSREPVYVHENGVFDRDTNSDNLNRKFYRFTKITKPRYILNYFIVEFEQLNVTDDHTKYHIIFGKWVPDEVSQYYGLVSPKNQNFQSFKECLRVVIIFWHPYSVNLRYTLTPPRLVIMWPKATEWATAHEDDRISSSYIIMLLAL